MGSFRDCVIGFALYIITKVSQLRNTYVYDLGTFRAHFNSFGMFCFMLDSFYISVLYYSLLSK